MYPIPAGSKPFQKQIARYKKAKSTVQFLLDKPLPLALIRKIVRYRLKQVQVKKKS